MPAVISKSLWCISSRCAAFYTLTEPPSEHLTKELHKYLRERVNVSSLQTVVWKQMYEEFQT